MLKQQLGAWFLVLVVLCTACGDKNADSPGDIAGLPDLVKETANREMSLLPDSTDVGTDKVADRVGHDLTEEAEAFETVQPEVADPCGDGQCADDEDPCTCPADCVTDTACCEADDCPHPNCLCCSAACMEMECAIDQVLDCCGNMICEVGEDPENCSPDCGDIPSDCGNEVCDENENPCDCPDDCPPGPGETGDPCCTSTDCFQPQCGDCCSVDCIGYKCSEPDWFLDCCGNGECEDDEDFSNCPADCG